MHANTHLTFVNFFGNDGKSIVTQFCYAMVIEQNVIGLQSVFVETRNYSCV